MTDSLDVFQLGSCNYFFTIRYYREGHWGFRKLGGARVAFDFGRVSMLFEHYR